MTRPAAAFSAPAPHPSDGIASRGKSILVAALVGGAIGCLALITLVSPGATRMFAWPWSLAFAGATLLPALALLARLFDSRRSFALPAVAWLIFGLGSAAVVLASALLSPYREPSLLWSTPLLAAVAVFLLVFDWLHAEPDRVEAQRERLRHALLVVFALIAAASMGPWLAQLPRLAAGTVFEARNPYPLGHSNYTAGLALLMLPTAGAVALRRGRWALVAVAVAMLALAMLFTSGSRGGLLGLAVLALAAVVAAPIDRRRKWQLAAIGAVAGLAFAAAHPRTRAMFTRADPAAAPNISNVQREAMVLAGWRMGLARPLLGWGPGTTPLVFPRYRAGLAGGAEDVLQLHSLPAQLWAELGLAGLGALLAFAALAARAAARDAIAAATLVAYGVFSLTDWQLDVPIFAAVVALCAALLAPSPPLVSTKRIRGALGSFVLLGLAAIALLGRGDPAPALNARALALAREPGGADRAGALFRASLALNPDQEIAHFNLGWLLVTRDPAAAERHFAAAAQLVPDKGGVYFGLGLARLNQGRRDAAAEAFALECLNDPLFLTSPWWREPAIAAARDATEAAFGRALARARGTLPPGTWAADQLGRLAAQAPQLGHGPPGPERSYRRERTGYPVLMRNLDLPAPVDLFDVREVAPSPGATLADLPPKGWLPSPLLLALLHEPVSDKP